MSLILCIRLNGQNCGTCDIRDTVTLHIYNVYIYFNSMPWTDRNASTLYRYTIWYRPPLPRMLYGWWQSISNTIRHLVCHYNNIQSLWSPIRAASISIVNAANPDWQHNIMAKLLFTMTVSTVCTYARLDICALRLH